MNAQTLELLEYEALRALVGRFVASALGRGELDRMEPSGGRAALTAALEETAEAMALLREEARRTPGAREPAPRLSFSSLPDPGSAAVRLRIEGTVLEALEIAALLASLERASEVRQALRQLASGCPRLAARVAALPDFRVLLSELGGKILPGGGLADNASVALQRIRREMERHRKLIQDSLERFLRTHHDDGLLQEEFITLRNDRFVVPIVPGARRKVPGVIHGASASGHTLFLEPFEAIELNNELVRLTEEELREVHRILREMTQRLRAHAAGVFAALEALGVLDFTFAKARFALEFDCAIPTFSPEGAPRLSLSEARHPLLADVLRRKRLRVVPLSLELNPLERTLLISGPNTGGKTVALKTAGLLALLAQSGLPVPAAAAEFPLFDDILADIGDNQSIEQSLSSFSAHIARVREMAEVVTSDSLVLLDELGRATDPEEGGALGVALLEEFRLAGAFTLASTHLTALKVYGASTPGVLNGSMGFDEASLQPTFQLRTGAPGKSAGLEIARRLGLAPRLIERAQAAMSSHERDLARLLTELERRLGDAALETAALAARRAELDAREAELARAAERRELARLREIEEQAKALTSQFEASARSTIEQILSRAGQRKEAERALRQTARTRREFQESVGELLAGAKPKQAAASAAEVVEGARVRLKDVGEPARVLRLLPGGALEVEVGVMKMQVAAEDVAAVLPAAVSRARQLPAGVSFTPGPRWDTVSSEINVIGKTAEEALGEVDKFLDSAVLSGVNRVRIVHGHGHGVLRRAVRDLLARHPHVKSHQAAQPSEGGTGATIAELVGD